MGPERIELSAKERERLKILQQVQDGHLQQIEAAGRLRLTARISGVCNSACEPKAILGSYIGCAAGHRIGRSPSPSGACGAAVAPGPLCGFRPHFGGQTSGPQRHRDQPRDAAALDECRRPVASKATGETVHVWRTRRSAFGELVMMDSSFYRWLEQRGPAGHLIAQIDDVTSRV